MRVLDLVEELIMGTSVILCNPTTMYRGHIIATAPSNSINHHGNYHNDTGGR